MVTAVHGERIGGERNGAGESGEERDPSSKESHQGMNDAGEEQIFTARVGQPTCKRAITQRTTECDATADQPRQQDTTWSAQITKRESRGSKDASTNHIGNDETGQGEKAQALLALLYGLGLENHRRGLLRCEHRCCSRGTLIAYASVACPGKR